jgi:hypothetical protein
MPQEKSGEPVLDGPLPKALRSRFLPPKGQNGGNGRLSAPLGARAGSSRGLTADIGDRASQRMGKPNGR